MQGSVCSQGRRGSAPILRPEEMWGGLRGGSEKSKDLRCLSERLPDIQYLNQRRSSAPSYHLYHGKFLQF